MRKICILIGGMLVLMLACSSPTDSSDDNLERTAEAYKTLTIPLVTIVE